MMNRINSFFDRVKEEIALLCRNSVTVSNKKEIITLPIIFYVIAIICVPFFLPAIICSLFCKVEYTFRGEDFDSAPKVSFR